LPVGDEPASVIASSVATSNLQKGAAMSGIATSLRCSQ
jgi:hypothetical protein